MRAAPAPAIVVAAAAALVSGAGSGARAAGAAGRDPNVPVHAGTERVVVTGEGDAAAGAPTSFVTILRAEEFEGRFATLADLLDETVGVRVRDYGGLHAFATVSIRGSTAEQVAVFVDGVPLNGPLGGGVNLADLPLGGVEAIEIHRGFTPASLGAGSIGGAVHVRTRRPRGDGSGSGSIGLGSYGTGTGSARGDGIAGPFRWAASWEGAATEGDFTFLDGNGTSHTSADDGSRGRINNASWSSAARLRGDAPLPRNGTLSVSAEWLRRRQGVPGIDAVQSEHATYGVQRGLVRAAAAWPGLGAGGWDLEAALDHEYTSQDFGDAGGPFTVRDRATRAAGTGARIRLLWLPAPAHRVSLLAEPRRNTAGVRDRLDPDPDPLRARRTSVALVAEDEIRPGSGRLLIAPSLRYESVHDHRRGGMGAGRAEPARDRAEVSGRIGAFVALSASWTLRANVGRYHRFPGILELFGDDGTIAGNPELRPESGLNADLGVAVHRARAGPFETLAFEAAAFRTDADDLIHLVPLSPGRLKPLNLSRARITGVEASAALALFGHLRIAANYTRQKPVSLGGTYAAFSDLPFRPRAAGDASASLSAGRAVLFHRIAYVGENDVAFAGSLSAGRRTLTRLPARYLHDAGVRVKLGARAEGTLEVLNLLDRHVVDVARYPLPGRVIAGRLSATF